MADKFDSILRGFGLHLFVPRRGPALRPRRPQLSVRAASPPLVPPVSRAPPVVLSLSRSTEVVVPVIWPRTVCERSRSRGETAGEVSLLLYSLLGNVCAAVGASLTRQLHIQV